MEESATSPPQGQPEESDRLQNDLAALRQTVDEEPEKRGWFGRKKKK
jgi:hypothetical protein